MTRFAAACVGVFLTLLPGLLRAGPGDVDSLNLGIVGTPTFPFVYTTLVQPDGKTIIGGAFTAVRGVPRQHIARLEKDGTLDMGFDPSANETVFALALQADGKILLSGRFTALQPNGAATPTTRQYLARLNADGSLDTGFNPSPNSEVYALAVQPDGKIVIGGIFESPRRGIARLNATGTLDAAFNPNPAGSVKTVALQPDGKMVIAGSFASLQPNGAATATARNHIARVNANGTLDTTFNPNPNHRIDCVALQPDGKVLLGGEFTSLHPVGGTPTARRYVARVNADGSLDTGFDPSPDNLVSSLALQADGKILIGGEFFALQPNGAPTYTIRRNIARVTAAGALDAAFDPAPNDDVQAVALQADGRVLVGGYFTTLQPNGAPTPTPRNYLARLHNEPASEILSAPAQTHVLWQRGGTAPAVSRVTFEVSTDRGVNWAMLGAGTRVVSNGNWQFTGTTLPASGWVRARGITGGAYSAGSGIVEQISTFAFPQTPYQQWKIAQFNDINAPHDGDAEGDDYENLAEYGLVLDPAAASAVPGGPHLYPEGRRLRMVFTRDPARDDVTIEVEVAEEMAGPWTVVASSIFGAPVSGPGYVGGDSAGAGLKTVEVRDVVNVGEPGSPRRFLRLRVRR